MLLVTCYPFDALMADTPLRYVALLTEAAPATAVPAAEAPTPLATALPTTPPAAPTEAPVATEPASGDAEQVEPTAAPTQAPAEPTAVPTEVPPPEPTATPEPPAPSGAVINLGDFDVVNLATGATENIANLAPSGATLLWFWAPH